MRIHTRIDIIVDMEGSTLSNKKLRKTKARRKILSLFMTEGIIKTAEEVYALCSAEMAINLSTVYRTLNTLAESGILIKSIRQDGTACFQRPCTNEAHHHHLVCVECRTMVDIDDCPITEIENKISKETGFLITGHTVELSGLCPDCLQRKKNQTPITK
ncbi:Fur family transcriptional regulator [Treponema phagedenis]|uniref:Fur family transcriptional regulator n=1 Tax=Treponema phagedenis TaxID=162 RepID=UPI0011F05F62|nr:Fur family transcriptional regulator [Treponema phagedenis]